MLTITINTRGLGWWINQGLRCPDCDSSELDVTENTKDDEVADGIIYVATINCTACVSNFTGSYLERG